jgi:hypothetical protein
MIDLNSELREAYFDALSSITPAVPVFYYAAPPNRKLDEYIVYRSITNKEHSTKTSTDTWTFVIVEIYSRATLVNAGASVDDIANKVLDVIYPDRHTHLSLTSAQIFNTEMTFDLVNPYQVISGEVYLSRYMTFKHQICQFDN